MRRFFDKQRFNKILAAILVCCMVVGSLGMNELFVNAEDIIYPAGVPTVATNGFSSGTDIVENGVQKGVQVSFVANGWGRAQSKWTPRQLSDGYRVDVEDFAIAENDSMILVMGPTSAGDYIDSTTGTYGIIYEYDGDFVVMAASAGGNLMSAGVVQSATKLAAQSEIDKLSIYIKSDGTKWDIVVDTYKDGVKVGDTYSTSLASTLTTTYFNFGAVGYATITDATTATITGWTNTSAASYMISYTGIPVQNVSLDKTALALSTDTTGTLKASISPATATNQTISWSSSDESVATVDQNGNVTALKIGRTNITAVSNTDSTKSATCQVKVTKVPNALIADELTDEQPSKAMLYSNSADDYGVQVVFPTGACGSDRVITEVPYSVEEGVNIQIEDIQAVDANYSLVMAITNVSNGWCTSDGYMLLYGKGGNLAIVRTSTTVTNGDPNKSTVIATESRSELGATLSVAIKKDGSDYVLTVNGTDYFIENATSVLGESGKHYLSFGVMSDFTITDGVVSDVKYWQFGNNIGRTDDVSFVIRSITTDAQSVSIDKEYLHLCVDETETLIANALPITAAQNVTWSSADTSIATIDENGTVKGVKAGTTTITATSKTDTSLTATCVVRVVAPNKYLTRDDLSNLWNTVVNLDDGKGVQVNYAAGTGAYQRVETRYTDATKHGYWPAGNGVHIGFEDIQLTNDTDTIALFLGNRVVQTNSIYDSLWFDVDAGGYMLFYSKGGNFAIVEVKDGASNNIDTVIVSEQREELQDELSFDVRYEDGQYELSVNGKTYAIPGQSEDGCPLMDVDDNRIYFATGLVTGFSVDAEGTISGPTWGTNLSATSSFTLTDISYISTEELTLPTYMQSTLPEKWAGTVVLGKGDTAATTELKTVDFNGTLTDSCEGLTWEITETTGGYYIKKSGGDESSYLNIEGTQVILGEPQVLTMERVSDATTAYTTISNGENYLCMSAEGLSASTSADTLILYSVRPDLAEATTEEPLFTLSTFADLHSERKYTSTDEEYIRDGIIEATQKVREQENANVVAFLGDLISNKSYNADTNQGFWLDTGEDIEEQWKTSRDKMYEAAAAATESGRTLFLTGNHEYAIGSLDSSNLFNSGDYTSGIESKLPELTEDNAYFQSEWPTGTPDDIKNAGHVLAYHYNIDGMDLISINTTYTGTEITSGWTYDSDALDWMESKLEAIGKDKTVIVLGHYPTSSLKTGDEAAYEKITGIFEQYPNVIYLYGHNHNPYIHTDTYQRVQTYAADGSVFQNRYETPTGYVEAFAGSVAFTNDVGLDTKEITGTPAVVQGLIVKVYSDRIVLQMKNYGETPLGVENLREYTIMRDVKLNVDENPQAAKTVEYTTAFPNFRDGKEMAAPVAPVGYVFAGWYYDEACNSSPVVSATKVLAEGTKVYAKFVPEAVLSVNAQTRYTTEGEKNKIDLRLVTTVDSFEYQEVGFIVTNRAGVPKTYPQQYVFATLQAAGYTKTPGDINDCSKRFGTINITGITVSGEGIDPNREIPAQAYWITMDGTTVYGPARTVKLSEAVAILESMN